jgi:2-polyprenyl-3-methyl-5-hydroxy-6-metoxy-1,4-benzoquinol methylase
LSLGAKPEGYYGQGRSDLVSRLPRPLGRVLDIGCGEGAAARGLRDAGATWVSGLEVHPAAAESAAAILDEVVMGAAEDVMHRLSGPFDTILVYDVLEHLFDPAAVLQSLHAQAAPAARLHVSVPNARHWSLVRDLVLRGTFGYTEAGHRDETHVRWFTRSDAVALLESNGWAVQRVEHGRLHPLSSLGSRLTRGLTTEFLVYQWSLLGLSAA